MGQAATKSGVVIWGAPETTALLSASGPGSAASSGVSPPAASLSSASANASPLAGSAPAATPLGGESSSFSASPALAVFAETSEEMASPRLVDALKNINSERVSAGGMQMAVVAHSGELYMWGANSEGQLGTGDRRDASVPRLVKALHGKVVKAVACSQEHTVCCLDDGSAYAWGCALNGRLGLHGLSIPSSAGLGVFSPATGARPEPLASACAVCTPRVLESLCGYFIADVACGPYHSAFLGIYEQDRTSLFTCGLGLNGRLGHGDEEDRHLPTAVHALENVNITAIACGAHHTACVTSAGTLYTWGGAAFGKLGLGSTRGSQLLPKHVSGPLRNKAVVSVALGSQHSACVTTDGELYTWGQGRRLGHEVQGESDEILPRRVEALLGLFVIHVVCGDAHTACIVENGNVWAWGTSRILGHGDPEVPPNRPACLRALNGKGVVQLSCASTFTVAFCDPQRVSAKATAAAAADVAACAAGVSVSDALGSSGAASVEAPALLKPSASGEKRDAGAESGTLRSSTKGDEEALATCAGVDAGGASLRPRGASACRKTGSAAFSAFPRVAGDADVSGATAGRAELEALGSTTAVTAPSAAGRLSPLPSAERDELLCEVGTISAALQAAQQENLLLVALLSGTAQQLREVLQRNALLERELDAMRKSSSDAGDRLATLREHYMQQIQQLQEQLAQQDTRLHAILASRGSQLLSSQGLLSRAFARPLPSSGASPPLSASSSAPLAVSAVDPGGQAFTPSSRASGAVAPGVSGAPEALTALPEETLEEALLDPLGQQPPPSRFLSFPSSPAFLPSQGVSPGGASSPRAARAASGVLGSTSPGASGSPETPPEAQGRSSKLLRQALGLGETPFSAHGLRVGREGRKRGGSLALFKSRGRDFLSQGLFADEAAAPSPLDAKKGENNGLALVPSQGDPSWASLLLTSSVDSGASARRHLSLEPSSVSGRSRGGARDKSGGLEGRSRGSSQSARVVTEGSSIPVFFLEEEM
ncbi:regulator of chromosome condensation (RCC1) repeat-containing protein [Toxoplasma gondii ME49]|uniref:Regulator of chromosome condensation (RCC1) repeat-containing protein n=4 Tax=Toxoplasma gondii TaxID=5811 RepID=A0A125YJI1_TOXGV|nr:regulator of chromosome condensation (RCC1) repeat-containing protein [Toxoplasma gondii ME49]EPT32341.1 regulator of chromosome condensation (RCC1) repeat-containing protein [Toxoplasma gondii ME49]ESS29456.1 regulator of chromosome condensation (RCC1) repeat-containing protein [Toxoplasma gondii VEG]KFG34900.1 regulator of chromosome condensation (RCC1) repeat-containing protein [Toxoplasma gondii GAB2-2007-GAL-DOM2]|eukprot:XP_018638453.1 regulator of chromosome condensation (RCC1) repeat-containing protein [Toxoplasma gondii ME49]